jgi:hypothetical protein
VSKGKFIVTAFLLSAVVMVLFASVYQPSVQGVQFNSNLVLGGSGMPGTKSPSSIQFAATYTAMTGLNATVVGTVHEIALAPVCSMSNPPCAIPNSVIFYLTTNGHTYRLLFVNGDPVTALTPYVGRQVVANGLVVVPSLVSSQWALPAPLSFNGDFYIRSILFYLQQQ